jgi:hypothetical protein
MYESPIMQKKIDALKSQGLLEYDDGPWSSKSILAAKTHQEEVNFKDYICRMAINYRCLDQVTKPFRYPIRRCDDSVQDIGDARFLLSMDLDAGFHQVSVHVVS